MVDAVGPAAYAERQDIPDLTYTGTPKIVPLRLAEGFHIDHRDPDPRGMPVIGADGKSGGVVREVWVDRAEYLIRYFEVETGAGADKRSILLPATMSRVSASKGQIEVRSILGAHFAKVPGHKSSDQVTRLEEDKICAYYAGGHLYATPARSEPLL
jgi:photosynthetic reaction center H subunit